jgi:ankyrin repeat protein
MFLENKVIEFIYNKEFELAIRTIPECNFDSPFDEVASRGREAMVAAAQEGRLDVMKALVDSGVDIEKMTPGLIKWSAVHRDYPMLKFLVENRAPVGTDVEAPLRIAAAHGELEMLKLMQSYGMSPVLPAEPGRQLSTVAEWAAQWGKTEIVEYLLEQGVDPCERDNESVLTALHYGQDGVVELLKSKGADVNAQEGEALKRCAFSNNPDALEKAKQHGVDVVKYGHNALDNALTNGGYEALKWLMENGVTNKQVEEALLKVEPNHVCSFAVEVLESKGVDWVPDISPEREATNSRRGL